jgi:two-component system response regulator YesN
MIKSFSGKRTIRLQVLVSASLLAILPVIILGISTYLIASHSLMKEISKAHQQTMKQVQERIDKYLVTVDKTVLSQALSPTFNEFFRQAEPYENPQKLREVISLLNSLEVLIDDIESVQLYVKEHDLLISPNGPSLAQKLDPYVKYNLENNTKPFYWLDRKSDSTLLRGGSHVVTLVRSLVNTPNQITAYIIININERAFFRVFRDMEIGNSGELFIITPNGNIFLDWSKNLLKQEPQEYRFIQQLIASNAAQYDTIENVDGTKMLLNHLKSKYNGWKYVSVVPYNELASNFNWIKKATISICVLLILVSLTAVLMLSNKFLRAVQGIVERIKKIGGPNLYVPNKMDEFGIIRHYVESMQSVNDTLEKQIKITMPLLRANFMQKLMMAQHEDSDLEDKMNYYDIPMSFPYFTVISIDLDNLRGHTEKDVNLFLYATINIAKEIISHYGNGVVVSMHTDQIAALINHGYEQSTGTELQKEIFHIAEEIRSVVEQLLKITVTVGVGNCYRGVEQIHRSYKESVEAMQCQLVQGSGRVLFIDHVYPQLGNRIYPVEQEQLIITNLKLGHLDNICRAVTDFADTLKKEKQPSYDHVRESFVQLIAASLRILYGLGPGDASTLFTYNIYQRLNKLRTVEQIVNWLCLEIYPAMIELVLNRRNQRNDKTIMKALDYLHSHYDEDLSLPFLADLVSMPVSHFGHMFKEETGMIFMDYLIAYRMEKAKEMLCGSKLKVSEIADKLRYNNSQNFIRTFKKITGMTPGEFRNRQSLTKQG